MQIRRVDADILQAVRQQSSSGTRARGDLKEARATVEELFGRMREIQRKAEQSELMVQEICRDIKKLDYAKKHLTATITAIRRLAMLLNAIGAATERGQGASVLLRLVLAWHPPSPHPLPHLRQRPTPLALL